MSVDGVTHATDRLHAGPLDNRFLQSQLAIMESGITRELGQQLRLPNEAALMLDPLGKTQTAGYSLLDCGLENTSCLAWGHKTLCCLYLRSL